MKIGEYVRFTEECEKKELIGKIKRVYEVGNWYFFVEGCDNVFSQKSPGYEILEAPKNKIKVIGSDKRPADLSSLKIIELIGLIHQAEEIINSTLKNEL